MSISPELLALLRCPESKQPLSRASAELIAKLAAARAAGSLYNRAGERVSEAFLEGLVREDGKVLYPVRDSIPLLLPGEGVEVA